jgi:hypothetical protein
MRRQDRKFGQDGASATPSEGEPGVGAAPATRDFLGTASRPPRKAHIRGLRLRLRGRRLTAFALMLGTVATAGIMTVAADIATTAGSSCQPLSSMDPDPHHDQPVYSSGVDAQQLQAVGPTDDLLIKSYKISGVSGPPGVASLEMELAGPPSGHPGYVVFYVVTWKADNVLHWVGLTIDSPTVAGTDSNPNPVYDAASGGAAGTSMTGPRYSWQAGTVGPDFAGVAAGNSFTVDRSTAVDHDPLPAAGNHLVMRIPYGSHAGPEIHPVGSSAMVFLGYLGGGGSGHVPEPIHLSAIPNLEGSTVSQYTALPTSATTVNQSGPGGAPFCGNGASVADAACPPAPSSFDVAPPPESVTCLPTKLPNWFAQHYQLTPQETQATEVIVDPVRSKVFEHNPLNCASGKPAANLVGFDADSLKEVPGSEGCVTTQRAGIVVDAADGLLLTGADASLAPTVSAISESTLKQVATFNLTPPTAAQTAAQLHILLIGFSWHAATHELVVTTSLQPSGGNTGEPMPYQLTVTSYKLSMAAPQPSLTQAWQVPLQEACVQALAPRFTHPAAYRSDSRASVYVPCVVQGSSSNTSTGAGATKGKTGIVRIALADRSAASKPCGLASADCAAGGVQVATTPGVGSDDNAEFLFDQGSDRAYVMLVGAGNGGTNIYVYDPQPGGRADSPPAFTGRSNIADQNESGYTPIGVDASTGRLYAIGFESGLCLIDGRRTPLSVCDTFSQFRAPTTLAAITVLPPSLLRPFSRAFVGYVVGDPDPHHCKTACRLDEFSVLADRVSLTADPGVGLLDAFTNNGPIGAHDTVVNTFSGDARGYGVHSDFVGSADGVLANNLPSSAGTGIAPFGAGTRDLRSGVVDQLTVTNTGNGGLASALSADSTARDQYANCSDVHSQAQCVAPPPPPTPPPSLPSSSPTAAPSQDPTVTQQSWPFKDATCVSPAPPEHPDRTYGSSDGAYVTSYDQNGKPVPTQVPNTAEMATASVNCLTTYQAANSAGTAVPGSAVGTSQFMGLDLSSASNVVSHLTVAQSITQTAVLPAYNGQGVISLATAAARGVRLELPGGVVLSIGEVVHSAEATAAGRAGTAKTLHPTPVLYDVTIEKPSIGADGSAGVPSTVTICQGQCTQDISSVVDQINANLPSTVHLSQPTPWADYAKGTPGGYTSAIEASLEQHTADQQFNAMSAQDAWYLPALRIAIYDDGAQGLNREIIDLAGVQVDAVMGIQIFPPAPPAPSPAPTATPSPLPSPVPPHCVFASPSPTSSTETGAVHPSMTAAAGSHKASAATPQPSPSETVTSDCKIVTKIPGRPGQPGKPGIPGKPGTPVVHHHTPGGAPAAHHGLSLPYRLAGAKDPLAAAVGSVLGGIPGVGNVSNAIEKFFEGFGIHLRDLKVLITMFAFLAVLATPLILMMRRHLWLSSAADGQ